MEGHPSSPAAIAQHPRLSLPTFLSVSPLEEKSPPKDTQQTEGDHHLRLQIDTSGRSGLDPEALSEESLKPGRSMKTEDGFCSSAAERHN